MALIRDLPYPVTALEDTLFATCSALFSTAESTAPRGMLSIKTTADAVASGAGVSDLSSGESTSLATKDGRVIDRLSPPLGSHYYGVTVQATLHSSRGSTEADRKLGLGVRLFHGDSSGGGDAVEYSVDSRAQDRIYFTSARTTDFATWDESLSSGALYAVSNAAYYDLRAAKRYLTVRTAVGKNLVTTESSGDEQSRLGAVATFVAGDQLPPDFTNDAFSTSTST